MKETILLLKIAKSIEEYDSQKTFKERFFGTMPWEIRALKSILKNIPIGDQATKLSPKILGTLHEISIRSSISDGPIYKALSLINLFVQQTRSAKPEGKSTIIDGEVCYSNTWLPVRPLRLTHFTRQSEKKHQKTEAFDLKKTEKPLPITTYQKAVTIINGEICDVQTRGPINYPISINTTGMFAMAKNAKHKEQKKYGKRSAPVNSIISEVRADGPIKKVENLHYADENKGSKIVFLIEGFRDNSYLVYRHHIQFTLKGPRLYQDHPEQFGTLDWAMENNCPVIDPIVSVDSPMVIAETVEKTLREKDTIKLQKLIVLSLCRFHGFKRINLSLEEIIEHTIKPAYFLLKEQKKITKIPDWVVGLNASHFQQFADECLNQYFFKDEECAKQVLVSMLCQGGASAIGIEDSYDRISRIRLINYLESHPEVDTIYAMVGKFHIGMIGEKWGDKILTPMQPIKMNPEDHSNPGIYAHVQLSLEKNSRHVKVHMFGGFHGCDGQYKKFTQIAKMNGLQKPIVGKGMDKKLSALSLKELDELEKMVLDMKDKLASRRKADLFVPESNTVKPSSSSADTVKKSPKV